MNHARVLFTAQVLKDGRVLVAGSESGMDKDDKKGHRSAEVYDPKTGIWTLTGSLNFGRYFFSQGSVLLQDGRVLVAGGRSDDWDTIPEPSGETHTAEIYDPSTGTWTLTGFMNTHWSSFPLVLMADGKVMAIGGRHQEDKFTKPNIISTKNIYVHGGVEIYDPSTGIWSPTDPLNTPREWHFGILLNDGRVLVGSGNGKKDVALVATEVYNPN